LGFPSRSFTNTIVPEVFVEAPAWRAIGEPLEPAGDAAQAAKKILKMVANAPARGAFILPFLL
jgi:hypothetical protein